MKTSIRGKLLTPFLILLLAIPLIVPGCEEESPTPPETPPADELSADMVPNTPLDVYVYVEQDSPTTIPADMINASQDIEVEALAVWGVPAADDEFALGMALTLTSSSDASRIHDDIVLNEGDWKMLSGNTIYVVQGDNAAGQSLRTAIQNSDFKLYDDSEGIAALDTLPANGETNYAATGIVIPSKALITYMAEDADAESMVQIDMILTLVNLKVIAGRLYSPSHIDVAEVSSVMEGAGNISDLDLGVLVLVRSGLPGILVKPALAGFLAEAGFVEIELGQLTLYQGYWDSNGQEVPVLVRIEGNHIFAAISGQQSYAETLITSINY